MNHTKKYMFGNVSEAKYFTLLLHLERINELLDVGDKIKTSLLLMINQTLIVKIM